MNPAEHTPAQPNGSVTTHTVSETYTHEVE